MPYSSAHGQKPRDSSGFVGSEVHALNVRVLQTFCVSVWFSFFSKHYCLTANSEEHFFFQQKCDNIMNVHLCNHWPIMLVSPFPFFSIISTRSISSPVVLKGPKCPPNERVRAVDRSLFAQRSLKTSVSLMRSLKIISNLPVIGFDFSRTSGLDGIPQQRCVMKLVLNWTWNWTCTRQERTFHCKVTFGSWPC